MQTSDPYSSERGWPHWALWAAIPIMLSLGFVFGLGLATYTGKPPASQQAAAPAPGDQDPPTAVSPNQPTRPGTGADQSWQVPGSGLLANRQSPNLLEPPPLHTPESSTTPPSNSPSSVYGLPAPTSLREARTVLAREFFRYETGNRSVRFDYQEMRHTGSGTSLVGQVSVADYAAWEAAVRTNPQALERWLEAALKKAQPAVQRDRFHLAWAVVGVVPTRPAGFADHEVTPLADGTFLVTRPLAASVDYNSSMVSLRSLDSLRLSVAGLPVTSGSPWATYSPLIRFDSTDIYRPTSAMPKR